MRDFLKLIVFGISTLIAVCSFAAECKVEPGFHQFKSKSDYATPLIPGSQYKVHQIDRPQPPRVKPGVMNASGFNPPSDATVLFDGGNLERFNDNKWLVKNGILTATKGGLQTKEAYGDCQLHIEWRSPATLGEQTNNMGNSGIKFMCRYELQIFDSYSCRIYADGSAGAVYGQTPPKVNVCRKPGEWQSYDVIFKTPKFKHEKLIEAASMTVLHNGVLIQNNTKILGPTTHKNTRPYSVHPHRLPFFIQAHSSPVEFRNIWIRDLETHH